MSVRHFIWDFDGMLFDTYPHTVAVFCECCRRWGIPCDPAEVYALFRVNLRQGFLRYALSTEQVAAFYELENDLTFPPVAGPYRRIPEILRLIADAGGKNYLYTHRDGVAWIYLETSGLAPLFSGGVTGEDGFPYKPAPDALEHILGVYGIPKTDAVMLGDRDIDIYAGQNAGIRTLLYDDEHRYGPLGETVRAQTQDELFTAVKALTGGR